TLDKINQYVRENLTGLRVIRAFAREDFQEKRFGSKNDEDKDLVKGLAKIFVF
ncbi:ABC transporter ATP-binding protein, partial [Streptococcus sp. KCJ4932]